MPNLPGEEGKSSLGPSGLSPRTGETVHFCQGGLLPTGEHRPTRAQAERGHFAAVPNPITTMKFTHKTDP